MQSFLLSFLFGEFPGFPVVDEDIGGIGQGHDFTQGAPEFARFVSGGDVAGGIAQGLQPCRVGRSQTAAEALADEAGAAAGDVDIFADQVGIDAGDKIFEVKVDVFHCRVELGGVVIAQPFGVQSLLQIAFGGDERAARLAHLGAVDGQKAVREDAARCAEAGVRQLGRPE